MPLNLDGLPSQNLEGKTPLDLAGTEEVRGLLRDPESAKSYVQ